jgi:hypothetical protein
MQRLLFILLVVTKIYGDPGDFRPPAVPLIVFSPHISGESYLEIFIEDKKKQIFILFINLKTNASRKVRSKIPIEFK